MERMKSRFWNIENFNLEDNTNTEIWTQSRVTQRQINKECNPLVTGVGAYQAMTHPDILPWVPDLVGKNFGQEESALLIGSAYALFIKGDSNRSAMPRECYDPNKSVAEFQERFLRDIVQPDEKNYYGPLRDLLDGIIRPDRICLTDLCKVSFVECDASGKYKQGDGVITKKNSDNWHVYERYVMAESARRWTWYRIAQCVGRVIIPLGSIAEHGLLKIFQSENCRICNSTELDKSMYFCKERWPTRYARDKYKLSSWIKSDISWWHVSKGMRTWKVLPVYHPSRHNGKSNDPGYRKTREALQAVLRHLD